MRIQAKTLAGLALLGGAWSMPAYAQAGPGETEGTTTAAVVAPSRIVRVADLRFGAFASPATASTIRVATDGTVSATGDVVATMQVPQPASGRGPAQFTIEQDRAFFFIAYYPAQVVINSGANDMLVDNTTARLVRTVNRGRNSEWRLDMGGTLNIDPNQQPGSYSGDFVITVNYF